MDKCIIRRTRIVPQPAQSVQNEKPIHTVSENDLATKISKVVSTYTYI